MIGLIAVGLIYLLEPILTPFLVGALLAYLCNPLVDKMVSWKVPRVVSVVIVFLGLILFFTALLLLLIPVVQNQISMLTSAIPSIIDWTHNKFMPWLMTNFGIQEDINVDMLKTTITGNLSKASGAATWILQTVLVSGRTLVEWTTNLILIPVVMFYLLRDWKKFIKSLRELLPRHVEPVVVKLSKQCDHTLSAFFRGQLLVMLSLGVIYSVGLSLVGLQLGIMIGMISGLVSIVPYLGFIVGILSATIAAYIQFGTVQSILLVWLVFIVGQSMESTFLTPRLVGGRIGLHPVAVIFAVLAGGMLFGFFGVLLALPVAAVIMVWLRYLNERYRASQLYQ